MTDGGAQRGGPAERLIRLGLSLRAAGLALGGALALALQASPTLRGPFVLAPWPFLAAGLLLALIAGGPRLLLGAPAGAAPWLVLGLSALGGLLFTLACLYFLGRSPSALLLSAALALRTGGAARATRARPWWMLAAGGLLAALLELGLARDLLGFTFSALGAGLVVMQTVRALPRVERLGRRAPSPDTVRRALAALLLPWPRGQLEAEL